MRARSVSGDEASSGQTIIAQRPIQPLSLHFFIGGIGCRQTSGLREREEYPRLARIFSQQFLQSRLGIVVILQTKSLFNFAKFLDQQRRPWLLRLPM